MQSLALQQQAFVPLPVLRGVDAHLIHNRLEELDLLREPTPGARPEPSDVYHARLRREHQRTPYEQSLALVQAVLSDDPQGVEQALAQGADPNVRIGPSREPALTVAVRMAAKSGHSQSPVLEALLARGADPNARGTWGETPLHEAAAQGSTGLSRTLIAAGADPSRQDNRGRVPAEIADAQLFGMRANLLRTLRPRGVTAELHDPLKRNLESVRGFLANTSGPDSGRTVQGQGPSLG